MDDISILNTDKEIEKVVYKRRSLIFHMQINTCDQNKDHATKNIEHQLISNSKEKEPTINDSKVFNLVEYVESLKRERKDWLQEYRKRKRQRKDLAKQKASIESQGQTLDMDILTKHERAFLMEQPNYKLICRNTEKLHDIVLKISIFNQLIHKLNQQFINSMEKNILVSTKEIIKMVKS